MPASPKHTPDAVAIPRVPPSSPTEWWRSRRPDSLSRKDVNRIRWAMIGSEIGGEPHWRRAILGSAPAAISIAVRQLKLRPIDAPEVDLALSALLCCAIEGCMPSAIVISSALSRRAEIDAQCETLSDLWLKADF
jgi:hypothetical protein